MKYDSIKVEIARDGSVIKELVHGDDALDWSAVYPYWLLASFDDRPVGCVQVCPSSPVGRMENLATEDDIDPRLRAMVVKKLMEAGYQTLREMGAQMAMATISFDKRSFKKLLKRRGCVVVDNGNVLAKRL